MAQLSNGKKQPSAQSDVIKINGQFPNRTIPTLSLKSLPNFYPENLPVTSERTK